jgi:AcrR family transcriptional regulator
MTEKQANIMEAALHLFAEQGFDATSTREIADQANVSEGLIFRHFTSKKGLLEAIMKKGIDRAMTLYERILSIDNPRYALKSFLRLPFTVPEDDYPFWRLLYSLRWQEGTYHTLLTSAMREALVKIMDQLGYAHPEAEADLAGMLMDGAAGTVLLRHPENNDMLLEALLDKYDL